MSGERGILEEVAREEAHGGGEKKGAMLDSAQRMCVDERSCAVSCVADQGTHNTSTQLWSDGYICSDHAVRCTRT